jgi:GDPmannose 4,6-dehydratase
VIGIVREVPATPAKGFHALDAVDLTDRAAVDSLIRRVQPARVFHLAAAHHGSEGPAFDPRLLETMLRTNFLSTTVLASALLESAPACRFVYAASSQMYTPAGAHAAVNEASPRRPATYYGYTKSWSLEFIALLRERHGLLGSSAILFNHESSRRSPAFVSRKLTQAAAAAARDPSKRVALRNIGAMTDWSAAEDVAAALLAMSEAKRPADYVVGSGRLRRVSELAEVAFRRVGLDWRRHVDFEKDETAPAVYADPGAIRGALGWTPRIAFEAMVERMVDADAALLARR